MATKVYSVNKVKGGHWVVVIVNDNDGHLIERIRFNTYAEAKAYPMADPMAAYAALDPAVYTGYTAHVKLRSAYAGRIGPSGCPSGWMARRSSQGRTS